MPTFRVLLIATDAVPTISQAIRACGSEITVVEATTAVILKMTVTDGHYDAICLQYPLLWEAKPSVTEVLYQWLPTCPILVFASKDHLHMLHSLVDRHDNGRWHPTA